MLLVLLVPVKGGNRGNSLGIFEHRISILLFLDLLRSSFALCVILLVLMSASRATGSFQLGV